MVPPGMGGPPFPRGCSGGVYQPDGQRGFYECYQVGGPGEPDETETEPRKEGELRTVFEGSHSPFGFIWSVASATGWTVEYIMMGVNYQTLVMMLHDAPKYVRRRSAAGSKVPQSGDGGIDPESAAREAGDIVNFYQSNLEL